MEEHKRMGRPPRYDRESLLKERLTILVTKEQKEYVLQHGGGEYIRRLVEEDQRKAQAAAMEDRG